MIGRGGYGNLENNFHLRIFTLLGLFLLLAMSSIGMITPMIDDVSGTEGGGSGTFNDPYTGYLYLYLPDLVSGGSTIWISDGTVVECDSPSSSYYVRSWNGLEVKTSGSFTCDTSDKGYYVCFGRDYARAAILIKECNRGEGTEENPFKNGDTMVMVSNGTSYIEEGAMVDVVRTIRIIMSVCGLNGIVSIGEDSTSEPTTMTALKIGETALYDSDDGDNMYYHYVKVVEALVPDLEFLSDPVADGIITYQN